MKKEKTYLLTKKESVEKTDNGYKFSEIKTKYFTYSERWSTKKDNARVFTDDTLNNKNNQRRINGFSNKFMYSFEVNK